MPFINVKTSASVSDEQKRVIENRLSDVISLIPGKSAPVTMAEIVPDCHLYFGSTDGAPCAIVDVACNNTPDSANLKEYSKNICKVLNEHAGIDLKRIYIKHHGNPEWHSGKGLFGD